MEWKDVFRYEGDIKKIAKRWAYKFDASLYEDACQHAMIKMYETVDLTKVHSSEKKFVVGAINNIMYKFFRSPKQGKFRHSSLDVLLAQGMQIGEDGMPRRQLRKITRDRNEFINNGNDR